MKCMISGVACSLFCFRSQSESDIGFFRKQKLVQVWFCCGISASLPPFPATLHQGKCPMLAALGATVGVRAEVVPHCFGGIGGEAETGLCCPSLWIHLSNLQSWVAGQPCPCEGRGSVHNLPYRFWSPPLVEPDVALLLHRLRPVFLEQGQRWPTLLVE